MNFQVKICEKCKTKFVYTYVEKFGGKYVILAIFKHIPKVGFFKNYNKLFGYLKSLQVSTCL